MDITLLGVGRFKNFLLLDATEVKLVAIKVEINLISVHTFSIFREKSL